MSHQQHRVSGSVKLIVAEASVRSTTKLRKQSPYVIARLFDDNGETIAEARSGTVIKGGKNPVWHVTDHNVLMMSFTSKSHNVTLWVEMIAAKDGVADSDPASDALIGIGMMEVGWRLREDAWGKGYAKEAAIASLDMAFSRFGAEEVIALTVAGNSPSWGLMDRLGMRRREDLDFANDEFDKENPVIIVYSIDADSWRG